MARLFVAVRPTPEVVALLAALERPAVPGLRWAPPSPGWTAWQELVPVTHPQPFQADVVLARGRVPRELASFPLEG
jgi:hypothetical protein